MGETRPVHLKVGEDKDGIVTACGPPLPVVGELRTTGVAANTTCEQCRRNPMYNWALPIAIRPNEARPFA